MENSSLEEKIAIIDKIIGVHPDLKPPLELHKLILLAQKELREKQKIGTSVNWNKSIVNDLQQKASQSNQPVASFLSPSIFDRDALLHTCEKVADSLVGKGAGKDWLRNFLDEMRSGRIDIYDAVGAALKGNGKAFENYGKRFKADPALILFVISSSIQPCLEEIARNVERSILEKWWQASCPVCGRTPNVAKLKNKKRYLACTFCGAEYLADIFMCANCGNGDPATLKFLAPEEHPEFRVDFCEKCMHYLKVIDEDKSGKHIPKGLEDIMTIDLDLMAKDAGLVRI